MRTQSNIVSFDDARVNRRRRTGYPTGSKVSPVESDHLKHIFEVDFKSDDADDVSAAIFTYEDESEEPREKKSFFAKIMDKRKQHAREVAKAKAEKQFEKSMGFSGDIPSDDGPRAALHEYRMGSKQRRATRMQDSRPNPSGISFSLPGSLSLPKLPKQVMAALLSFACILILAASLYTPAQNYYKQIRERDRLAAEYAAIEERNESLQAMVDNLQSKSGIEDKAHEDFGLVKSGEKAGSVSGIDVEKELKFEANIPPGTIPAPDTWYSGFLDVLFGYNG